MTLDGCFLDTKAIVHFYSYSHDVVVDMEGGRRGRMALTW